MIDQVSFEQVTYKRAPARFEAGTTILAGAVGLAAALDYLDGLGLEAVRRHEHELLAHATEALAAVPGLRLIGTAAHKVGVLSFVLEGVDTEAMGRFLDHEGIAVRVGRHCAQPTMRCFGVTGTVRPSFALYNTHAEVDVLVEAVGKARAALA
jgi:cysteine desulfurase/selenocysteine lyase